MEIQKSILSKRNVIIGLVIISGIALLQLAPVVKAATTNNSPTIYDSTYIDEKLTEINNKLEEQTNASKDLKKQLDTSIATQKEYEKKLVASEKELADLKESLVFKIIKLPAGKVLIGDASTEIIVRNKDRVTAYVESTATGGVSNLISGKDIKNGEVIPDNQLLLIPKSDGRGIKAKNDADIMIKGTYTIQ